MFLPRAVLVRTCIVLWTACWIGPIRADDLNGRFLIRSWQSEEGLPGNVVRSIAQATDGYLWIATAEGVVRFDGVRFTGFYREPDATLSRISPRSLFALPDGSVWIATRGGLLRWDGRALSAIIEEPDNMVPANQLVPVTQVFTVEKLVYVIRGQRAFRWEGGSKLTEVERTPDLQQRIEANLSHWNSSGRTSNSAALPQLQDRRGRIWRTVSDGGVTVEETQADNSAPPTVVLEPGSQIAELMEDREGNIWAASGESGLIQIRERRVSVLSSADGLSDRVALVTMQDSSGALWVGNKRGGIDRIKGSEIDHYEFGEGGTRRPVSAICEDAQGTIWAATANGSLFRFEHGTFEISKGQGLALSKVNAIATSAGSNEVWFAGVGVLARLKDENVTRFDEGTPLSREDFTALAAATPRTVWAGTKTGKLWNLDGERFVLASDLERSGRMISALLPDGKDGVWITTLGAGLFHFASNGRLTTYGWDTGLPELRLTTVIEDGLGYVWLGSLSGIIRVSRQELDEIASGRRASATWIRFDRSDGLLSRECSGGFQPASWRVREGVLLFPTINGLARIRPESITLNRLAPPVVIESIRAQGRTFDFRDKLPSLGPGRTRMEVSYTGLSFAAPEKVRFRTRLEGLEDEWRDVADRRTIQYEALPPGRYVFRVQAANGDGVWNEKGASLPIVIAPHFWETAWFRVMLGIAAAAAAGAIGWGIARQRLNRRMARLEMQRVRETERARIAQDLHDDLGASLTEISMLASIAVEEQSAGENSPEALPEIADKAHALVGALDEIVWAVNPRHDTVASLADYLSAFAADFLEKAGITLRLDIPKELPVVPLEAEQRHSLFLAVREALNNVVKHAHATEVRLQLRAEDSRIVLRVEDDGTGLPELRADGEGLRNMRDRLERAAGSCVFAPSETGGTRVTFTLPITPAKPVLS